MDHTWTTDAPYRSVMLDDVLAALDSHVARHVFGE